MGYFEEWFGFVQYLHMDENPTSGRTSGTGYVDFLWEEDAWSAINSSPIEIGASCIRLRESFVEEDNY